MRDQDGVFRNGKKDKSPIVLSSMNYIIVWEEDGYGNTYPSWIEEEKKEEEGDTAAGLGALFG